MVHKFKIGDKVKIPSDKYEFDRYRDEVAEIIFVSEDTIRVRWPDGKTSTPSVDDDLCGMYKVKEETMSKFKVGDKVIGIGSHDSRKIDGLVGTITLVNGIDVDVKFTRQFDGWGRDGSEWTVPLTKLTLLSKGEEMKPYQRRTFKLLVETPTVKKNALYEEACDDGDQEYVLLDESFSKDEDGDQSIHNRSLVEDSKSFVEVFKVTPEFMTREELDQWEEFKKGGVNKTAKVAKAEKPKYINNYEMVVAMKKQGKKVSQIVTATKLKVNTVNTYISTARSMGEDF